MAFREVFALHCAGPFTALGAFLDWNEEARTTAEENYYAWYISGTEGLDGGVLVDAGPRSELLAERKEPTDYRSPRDILTTLGVHPDAVASVVLTHLHWDHCGGIDDFPTAQIVVQRAEYDFWINDPIARRAPFASMWDPETGEHLAATAAVGRLTVVDGEAEIAPGVHIVPAPGHTPGLQAVAVETERGTAVVASDAAHLFSNVTNDTPSAYTYDRVACVRTYDRLRQVAAREELIFPGHDPRMTMEYECVAERVTRLV